MPATHDQPRLLPVVLAVLAFPAVSVAVRFGLPRRLGLGALTRDLIAELALLVVTVAIVAWARWWRQTGLAGPWRDRWWSLLAVALLLQQLLFSIPGLLRHGDPGLLPGVLPLVVMVGFCEETLTRGVMLYGLSRYGPLAAGLGSAVIFGVLHASGFFSGLPPSYLVVQIITAILLGLLFAALRLRMISLWPTIVTHAAFDVPALLEGYPAHVVPVDPVAALVAIGLMLPFGMAGLGLLLWDQFNGINLTSAAGRVTRTRMAA